MNNSRSHLDAVLDRRNLSGEGRLASLNRSIESIERKLNDIGAVNSGSSFQQTPQSAPSRIEDLERRLHGMTNNQHIGGSPRKERSSTQGISTLAEIAERKQSLYDSSTHAGAGGTPFPNQTPAVGIQPSDNADLSFEVQELGAKIDNLQRQLGSDIGGLYKSVAKSSQTVSTSDNLERIAEGIRELQQTPRFDPSAFDALHNDLDDLRLSIGSATHQQQIGTGFAEINSRLDNIANSAPEMLPEALSDIQQSLNAVASNTSAQKTEMLINQVNTLSEVVGSLSESMELGKLDNRLQTLVEAVDHLVKRPDISGSLEPNLTAIENRLDEITRAIVAVSVNEQTSSESDPAIIERLEQQIANLGKNIELIAQASDGEAQNDLAMRIESLAQQMEVLDGSIQNVGSAVQLPPNSSTEMQQQLAELSNRIEGLSNRFGNIEALSLADTPENVAAMAAAQIPSQIESQLQELANRIDAAADSGAADGQLLNLEQQIASIAEKLSGHGAAPNIDFAEVGDRLGQIEQSISANRDLTLETISQATRSAIDTMDNDSLSGELIGALSEDLKALRSATDQTESSRADTLNAVQNTLLGVASRLETIENSLHADMPRATVTSDMQNSGKPDRSIDAGRGGRGKSTASEIVNTLDKIDQAPSIDPSAKLQPEVLVEDNRPLEPGSGAPDISSIVKRAADKFKNSDPDAVPYGEKTDFVAAARRAAQSAAAEVKAVSVEEPKPAKKPGKVSKLPNIPRRPVIIAAAAILMAVVAFAGTKMYLGNSDHKSTAVVKMPTKSEMAGKKTKLVTSAEKSESNPVRVARTAVPNETRLASGGNRKSAVENSFDTSAAPKQTESFAPSSPSINGGAENTMKAENGPETTESPVNGQEVASSETSAITSSPVPSERLGPASLRQAAATGDAKAQYEIGLRYTNGTGVKRNLGEAAKWYELAAAQEFAPAQYRLGSLYEKGLGVKRDLTTAANWYQRAADTGNARAMHNLAVINTMGTSGDPDMAKALKWFNKAANLGVKDSQFNLGILYGQGMGVSQNLAESYKWFALAAKTGDTDSAKKRDEVANVMDPAALETARLVVNDWRPEKLDDSANRVVIPEEWRNGASSNSAALNGKTNITKVQTALNKLGYSLGTPDGVSGPKTRRAIISFQKKAGLALTGEIDAPLMKALKGLSI